MSELIKHECGIALIRLLKPLEYYHLKYGSWKYGLNRMYLLMEKQHNRGQDGAGLLSLKLDMPPGKQFFSRERSNKSNPLQLIFNKINKEIRVLSKDNSDLYQDPLWVKENLPFAGELYMGHLRYGTYGMNSMESVHPVMRINNWRSRNLALAGNFNLTNVDELFGMLMEIGQHPKNFSDTVTVLEKIGYYLDEAHQELYHRLKGQKVPVHEISQMIEAELDLSDILANATKRFDGGYAMIGILGHGDAFVTRDPWGIRPAFYYHDDEVAIVASERPVIQTVMNVDYAKVKEVPPGHAFIVKKSGEVQVTEVRTPQEKRSCSFERIYFSRGSDLDIYRERKKLGNLLVPQILKAVNNDLENTVFSYIPNTAESAFYGMIKGIEEHLRGIQKKEISGLGKNKDHDALDRILQMRPRVEKIAIKDVKLRTFIAADKGRDDLVGHVYDITYGTVQPHKDTLVIIDDSIVRGTTLKMSILQILDRLKPKKIVIVSSSPQIRYPDCYGIDMAKLSDFVAFQAAIELLKEKELAHVINQVYNESKAQLEQPAVEMTNPVQKIYEPLEYHEVSSKIAQMLKTKVVNADVEIVYQTIENLHVACPDHLGDWYFTGNYPTPGGNKVVCRSFVNFIEGRDQRAY